MCTFEDKAINRHEETNMNSQGQLDRRNLKLWRRLNFKNVDLEGAISSQKDNKHLLDGDAVQKFLAAVQGNVSETIQEDMDFTTQQKTYLQHIKQMILSLPMSQFDEILSDSANPENSGFDKIFILLTRIAHCTRKGNYFSIDKAIDECFKSGVLSETVTSSPARDKARVIFFTCTSWISMLYPPVGLAEIQQGILAIDSTQCACMLDSQPVSSASRPICEMIQDFGPLLPVRRNNEERNTADPVFSKELLYVSLLNAKVLAQIGGIEIVWIAHVSSHLVFDPETLKLFVFRLPSFCDINRYQSSAFAKIVEGYYDEFNKPSDFTSAAFMKEIRRSYGLLFTDDRRARAHYARKEQKRARFNGMTDPYLDILCAGKASERGALRTSYSKRSDFPILADRLSIIQEYIKRQNPKTLSILWHDRRNLLQWYTFWAVAVIGGIGIILSLAQTCLTAAQLYYAIASENH